MASAMISQSHKNAEKKLSSKQQVQSSVLDDLEGYWKQQDAISAKAKNDSFGIMAKEVAQDLMLMGGKKAKRTGAFCLGI